MVTVVNSVETAHLDMIHDAQMDYYGNRLATCSSDRTVKIFDIRNGEQILVADLRGHEGPVWQVAWAHAMYGNVLASCAYDRKVIIWREEGDAWERIYEYAGHESSVNSVSWAPREFGLVLACGSSDGAISVLSCSEEGGWDAKKIGNAHSIGCNAVSWGPVMAPVGGTPQGPCGQKPIRRFVSGGCDNLVKIWREKDGQWVEEQKLEAHSDWVRDVAWAPSIGLPISTIASCAQPTVTAKPERTKIAGRHLDDDDSPPKILFSHLRSVDANLNEDVKRHIQDGRVYVWRCEDPSGSSWVAKLLHKFGDVVWHVSWSITGSILAVSGGDNRVTLWQESQQGQWVCVSDVDKSPDGSDDQP